MQLKALQKKIPSADAVAGRIIAFHEGKHYDLGEYVGDGLVILSRDAEQLLAPPVKVELKNKPKSDLHDVNFDDLSL
jgi:hypothetical protein